MFLGSAVLWDGTRLIILRKLRRKSENTPGKICIVFQPDSRSCTKMLVMQNLPCEVAKYPPLGLVDGSDGIPPFCCPTAEWSFYTFNCRGLPAYDRIIEIKYVPFSLENYPSICHRCANDTVPVRNGVL